MLGTQGPQLEVGARRAPRRHGQELFYKTDQCNESRSCEIVQTGPFAEKDAFGGREFLE